MMKLCGRIEADQSLIKYRHLLREATQSHVIKARPKKQTIEQHSASRCFKKRLANAAR